MVVKYNLLVSFLLCIGLLSSPSFAKTFHESHGNWNVLTHEVAGEKLCYVTSTPVEQRGDKTARGEAFAMVIYRTNNPAEVSFSSGYEYDLASIIRVVTDGETFGLISKNDRAWTRMEQHDRELMAAISRGQEMELFGKSVDGKSTIDVYSLVGSAKAMKSAKALCSNSSVKTNTKNNVEE